MSRIDDREKDIGKLGKTAITIWLFSGLFGVIILMSSSTPTGLYLGWFFLFVSFVVVIIWVMWYIACKADELVGRYTELGVEIEEQELSHQIKSKIVQESNESNTTNQPMSNGKIFVIGSSLAVILYWVTTIT